MIEDAVRVGSWLGNRAGLANCKQRPGKRAIPTVLVRSLYVECHPCACASFVVYYILVA